MVCTPSKEEWKNAQEKAFKKVAKEVQIPGFRKGKAPEAMLKGKVDPVKVMDEAVNSLLPDAYSDVMKDKTIIPYAQPKVEVTKLSEDELEFKFVIVVQPTVKLGQYKGLKLGKSAVEVNDDEVEEEVKKLLENNASLIVKEGASELGDTVIMDFKGYVDGKEFEGGSATNHELVLGSKAFIPGFEEQLVGHVAGDDVEVKVTFPEQYTEELKGKDATFACHIHEVKAKKLAALDDEFVKDQNIENVNTVDELKAHLKTKKLDEKTQSSKNEYLNKALDEIVKNSEIDLPEEIVEEQFESRKKDFVNRMSQSGLKLEQYLQILGQSEEQLDATLKSNAEKEVKQYLVLDEIANSEKIDVSDKDLDDEMAKIAEQYHMEIDNVKKTLEPQLAQFKNSIKMGKTEQFIVDNND